MESAERTAGEGEVLLLQAGERHCALVITDKEGKKVYKLLYCSLDPLMTESLETFLAAYPETGARFSSIAVSYDFPSAWPAPPDLPTENKDWTAFFDDTGVSETKLSETVPGKTIGMVYTVPAATGLLAAGKFRGGKYWHQYSVALHAAKDTAKEGVLGVDFRPDEFMVTAAAGNKILLVQTFTYSVPEDVLYYLLKICRHLGLSQQQVQVSLSGLIDKDSALFKELYQYFLQVSFREAGWEMPEGDYPAHYFTSLNDLARCAL